MQILKQQMILFWKTKQCSMVSLLLVLGTFGFGVFKFIQLYLERGTVIDIYSPMAWSLKWQIYGFIIFMFVAFEYFSLTKKWDIDEMLGVTKVSKVQQEITQFICLMLVNFLYFVLHLLIFILHGVVIGQLTPELFLYTCKLYGTYMIGLYTIAILIGYLLSKIPVTMIGYVLMVLVALFATLRAQQIAPAAEIMETGSDLTQIFCVGANWVVNAGFLYPVEVHFVIKTVFFIALLAGVIFCLWFVRDKKVQCLAGAGIMVVLAAVSFVIWNQGAISGCYYGYQDDSVLLIDEKETVKPDFYVTGYEMQLDIDTALSATVNMKLSDASLDTYAFTLFAGYQIHDLTDDSGNQLEYTRDGNTVTILNPDRNLSGITIRYSGVGTNQYFAGKQGICLPGNFPYYPMAGVRGIMAQGCCELFEDESEFTVVVNYKDDVYSNLDKVEENQLQGVSNNFTLVGGFWEQTTFGEITYLHPQYSASYNPQLNSYLRNGVETYWMDPVEDAVLDYTIKDKLIMVAPYDMEGGHYMFGTDVVMIGMKADLDQFYVHYLQTGRWHMSVEESLDAIP